MTYRICRLLCSGLAILVGSGLLLPGISRGQVGGEDSCALDYKWQGGIIEISSQSAGNYDQPVCEPIPLIVDAGNWVVVDERCEGCDETSNKFVELETNIEYSWIILGEDGGTLSTVANDESRMGATASGKAVLYHPPTLDDGEQSSVVIEVTARNADDDKPVPSAVTGVFTIELTAETREETTEGEHYTLTERSDHMITSVTFVGDVIEGPGGSELIYECDPTVDWDDKDPISGDFWVAEKVNPISTLVSGDIVVLTAEGADKDEMILTCLGSGDCSDSASQTLPVSDTLIYEWSVTAGSLVLSDRGAQVIYLAPLDPMVTEVTISLTISDTMTQYLDESLGVQKTFPIQSSEVNGAAAGIRHVAEITYPSATQATPTGAVGEIYHIPYYSFVEHARRSYWDIYWTGSIWRMEIGNNIVATHPWRAIAGFFDGALQDPPPSSFPDFDAVQSWAGSNVTDHWSAQVARLEANRRRDVIRSIDDVRHDTVIGKLPIRSSLGFDLGHYRAVCRSTTPAHAPISGHSVITIQGSCKPIAEIQMICTQHLGQPASQILVDTTNRIHRYELAYLTLKAHAAGGGYTSSTTSGGISWPRAVHFHGEGDDPLSIESIEPAIPIWEWVNQQIPIGSAP